MGIRVKLAFDLAAKHRLDACKAWAQCFGGVLVIRRGDSRLLRAAFEGLPEPAIHSHISLILAELAEGLGGAGRIAEGLAVIDKPLGRAERTEERWFFAELLWRQCSREAAHAPGDVQCGGTGNGVRVARCEDLDRAKPERQARLVAVQSAHPCAGAHGAKQGRLAILVSEGTRRQAGAVGAPGA